MPEKADPKSHQYKARNDPGRQPATRRRHRGPRYAELHAKTNFSFLEGASHPDELVYRAAELGYDALAITDRNSLAGVVRAHVAAKDLGLKLLIGAEITPTDAPPVILLATDRAAYGRLSRLITRGRRRAEKGACQLTFADVAEHAEGLLACVVLGGGKGDRSNLCEAPFGPFRQIGPVPFSASLHQYRDAFADRCYALAELHLGPDDRRCLARMVDLARQARLPLVAANDVHYHVPQRRPLQDVLTAIRHHTRVAELGHRMFPNAERYLKSPRQMAELFADDPQAVARTVEVAARCTFSLDELQYEYPEEQIEGRKSESGGRTTRRKGDAETRREGRGEDAARGRRGNAEKERETRIVESFAPSPRLRVSASPCSGSHLSPLNSQPSTPLEHLSRLAWEGAEQRYPHGVPEKVRRLVEHELKLIEELHYEAYFLTVWDLVRFARSRGILCQGRGSAANSAVCYLLGITSVDPDTIDVLFERFVSKERNEAPDIDVDFEHERREEVIQYVYEKYGRDRAGMTASVITYRPKSAVRDVAGALGLSLDRLDLLAKMAEAEKGTGPICRNGPKGASHKLDLSPLPPREAGLNLQSRTGRQLMTLVSEILGFPRHLSQHVGGLVITRGPLCELVPIENAAMPDRTVIQWDKDDLDALGILKVDCLALGMLTAIHKCFNLIQRHHGRRLTLATVPKEDRRVYEMIQQADTVGVFQIESRAQMSMLPRLRPQCFYDLVIEVAIVRPGPIQGDMVHPYLRRRAGKEPVEFPDERIRAVLGKTLGVPIFQEQAMRLAVVAAGFTPGEADQLRRAMGAWRRRGVIDAFRQKLIRGMQQSGYSAEFAERVFRQIRGFGEYGFPESHAASFALLVYISAWLKWRYPAVFTAALLNSQPMGFYRPAQLVSDARRHDVEVRPVDVNFSNWDCTLESGSLRKNDAARGGHGDAEKERETRIAESFAPSPRLRVSASPCSGSQLSTLDSQLPALRLGLRMVGGLSRSQAESIVRSRAEGPFESFADFAGRTGLSKSVLTRLSRADAFGSLKLNRRDALWQSLPGRKSPGLLERADPEEPPVELPAMSPQQEVVADYRTLGLSLKDHPVKFLRPVLRQMEAVCASELATLPANSRLKVAGLVLLRQRPGSASGITFVTLEDETALANLIVRPEVWDRYARAARTAQIMLATGTLQRQDGIIHVLTDKLEDLSSLLEDVHSKSRDFR